MSAPRGEVWGVEDGEQLTMPIPLRGAGHRSGSWPPRGSPRGQQAPGRGGAPDGAATPAAPVARVVLDVSLAHLDRPFDYAVPEPLAASALPGARVSARFAGRDVPGYVVERVAHSEFGGPLAPLRRVVSPVPVLTPQVLATARAVADHYAGTLADVLRLAVPPRHARVEAEAKTVPEKPQPAPEADEEWAIRAWSPYQGGPAFLSRLAAGESPRAVWSALPGTGEACRRRAIAAAVAATARSGRGSIVVVPESREVDRLGRALDAAGIAHARLVAEDGPAARYRAFLRVLRGEVRVAVGTRAAAFAPVADLGLVAVWDAGDDLLAEPRAPYPHALAVLRIRAGIAGCAALVGGIARSTAAQQLLEDGWARPVLADRRTVRERTPRIVAPGEADLAREGPGAHARVPHPAWELVREALAAGPVLVQVPRAGYVPVTACARCRGPARCGHCRGPLRLERLGASPACSWCGRPAPGWTCPECGGTVVRAGRIGSSRTAEELGRAFPGAAVVVSASSAPGGVLDEVGAEPCLVVATPGAEPEAAGGYAAALLLDAAVTSGRPELWAAEEALRRWLNAAALVRDAPHGGRVMLLGHGAPVPVQALVRWDPGGFASRELAERAALGFPPAVAIAAVEGPADAVAGLLDDLDAELGAEVLGPVPVGAREGTVAPRPVPDGHPAAAPGAADRPPPSGRTRSAADADDTVRAILRMPRRRGADLAHALAVAAAARSARKAPGGVRVQVDTVELW